MGKGRVAIENFRGRLRLVLPRQIFEGKQIRLSLGIPDNPQNRIIAEAKAREIELDYGLGRLDPTLEKYRLESHKPPSNSSITEIFEAYADFKAQTLEASSLKDFERVRRYLKKCPVRSPRNPKRIRDWLLEEASPDTAKRILTQLQAASRWAADRELIDKDYFAGLYRPRAPKSQELDIDPFSELERRKIFEAFQGDHFEHYVGFLFSTGCRPSEAIALTWEFVDPALEKIYFHRAIVERKEKGPKTKRREFPCNEALRDLLKEIRERSPSGLLFRSKEGLHVDPSNFWRRDWKPKLEIAGVRYRRPYQCRHTFISECVNKGIPLPTIADWVGNSPKVILDHYADKKSDFQPPILT
jgi:integrase